MALEITIQKSGKIPTYYLKCENIEHSFARMPTQTGFPAEGEAFDPKAFLLDIGVCIEQIALSGIVDDEDDGTGLTTKANMDTVVRSWWGYGDTAATLLNIGLPSKHYYGAIRNCSFRKMAGSPNKWDFSLTFLVFSEV